jgi:hypothetical protein
MNCLTVVLPELDSKGKGKAAPAASSEMITISGIVDEVEIMSSLQKPKKVSGSQVFSLLSRIGQVP